MASDYCDALWQEGEALLQLAELAQLAGLSEGEVRELVAHDVLAPEPRGSGQLVFSMRCVTIARTAHRLGEDYALEPHAVAVVLAYLDRIRELEAQLRALQAQLPR
jgi:chaperone modulatory protein CbpM